MKRGDTIAPSINGTQSYTPSFLSSATQISQTNPTFQYYYLKNQSAVPVSIILRNQHVSDKNRRKQWHNHPVPLLKTKLEIFYEEEVSNTSPKLRPDPLVRQASDVSALSSSGSDSMSGTHEDDKDPDCQGSESSSIKSGPRYCVVYSKEHEASLHSCWNHLTDILQSLHADLKTNSGKLDWFHDPRYMSMKARVLVSADELQRAYTFHSSLQRHDDEEGDEDSVDSISFQNDNNNSNNDNNDDPTFTDPHPHNPISFAAVNSSRHDEDSTLTIATIPLHPTLLRRLPPPLDNPNSSSTTISKTTIPSALPLNTLLVQYSDGSLRILPPLYKLLLKKNIICEKSFDVKGTDSKDKLEADRINESKRTIRFSDDAFEALKAVEKKISTGDVTVLHANQSLGNKQIQKLQKQGLEFYHDDNAFSLLGDTNAGKNGIAHINGSNHTNRSNSNSQSNVFDDVWKGLQPEADPIHSSDSIDAPVAVVENAQDLECQHEDISLLREEPDHTDYHNHELNTAVELGLEEQHRLRSSLYTVDRRDSTLEDDEKTKLLNDKVAYLEKLVMHEENALKNDEQSLEKEVTELKSLMSEIRDIERESDLIRSDTQELTNKFSHSEFLVSTRQTKLLKELSQIYPIKSLSKNRFAIRNLEIPTDLTNLYHSSAHDDSHISSALGYTSHAVYMCSKYLSVPLRYKLICNASRSAVQGGQNGNLYPLFKEKVEKDQFDMAVTLLDRNVDCLLLTGKWRVDIDDYHGMNMLDKLSRLFKRVTLADDKDEDAER